MIGNDNYSKWGLKDSGEDITSDIRNIVTSAHSFIVVGGYNFSFKTSGIDFLNDLAHKATNGTPVLLLCPPRLFAFKNHQPQLIQHCITHGIGVILNHQNHSKWLLTENHLYYGSSNFSQASWKNKVEVVTFHKHTSIKQWWKKEMLRDFKDFIQREINDINRRTRKMYTYPGLIALTIGEWNKIRPLIHRLNPSIEKVKQTLENYEDVEIRLYSVIEEWFLNADLSDLEDIYAMNTEILTTIRELCAFGYEFIYNESITNAEFNDQQLVERYNKLHNEFSQTLNEKIIDLETGRSGTSTQSDLMIKNRELINKVQRRLEEFNP